MIIDCLLEIVNSKLDLGDKRKKVIQSYINYYDNEQLLYILGTPMGLVMDDISIFFFPGVGFRCSNDTSKTGRLPICNTIQNILNRKYQELNSDK
jgi:hypothetical protein